MTGEYKVKVLQFEGPLEVILDLIEKKRLHINDISLAEVTDGYVEYMNNLSSFPTEDATNFIAIASTLILIKSISLLPTLAISEEESASIEELEERLRILRDIKGKSVYIKKMFGKNIIFMAEDKKNVQPVFSPTSEITVDNFLVAIKAIIASMPKREVLEETIIRKVVSLEEAINDLIARVEKDLKMSFYKMNNRVIGGNPAEKKAGKINLIINFLAVLELVKRGIILVKQETHFCDIGIESGKSNIPVYN